MTSLNLGLVSALLYFSVAVVTGEPSCTDVEDFGHCTGDAGDFCPRGIACSCRSSQPFCSCPYYTGPNGNYWYLGEKCDQLWSTLDMIVICVFPAVALAFIVAVTAQLIHFCKMKPYNKTVNKAKNLERKMTSTHQNQTYVPDPEQNRPHNHQSMVNVQEQVQPKIQTAQWTAPAADPPKPRRLNYYSDVPPVGRSSNYFEGRQQSQNYGYRPPEQDFPDYEQQYSRIARAAPAPDDYLQRSPEPSGQNTAWDSRPFSFGRPQVKAVYNY